MTPEDYPALNLATHISQLEARIDALQREVDQLYQENIETTNVLYEIQNRIDVLYEIQNRIDMLSTNNVETNSREWSNALNDVDRSNSVTWTATDFGS